MGWFKNTDEQEQSIYKDDAKVEELQEDMQSLSEQVGKAKEAVQNAIEELNNVNGMDRIGSINMSGFDEGFDSLDTVIKSMATAVQEKAEAINNYANANGWERFWASAAGAGVSLFSGVVGAGEQLVDGAISLVGGASGFITGGATDDFFASVVGYDVSGNISHAYYNSEMGQKCAWDEDSAVAHGLEFVGEVGISVAAAVAIPGVGAGAVIAGAGLEGVGSATENRLLAGDSFNDALKVGAATGALTAGIAAATLGIGGKFGSKATAAAATANETFNETAEAAGREAAEEIIGETAEEAGEAAARNAGREAAEEAAEESGERSAKNLFRKLSEGKLGKKIAGAATAISAGGKKTAPKVVAEIGVAAKTPGNTSQQQELANAAPDGNTSLEGMQEAGVEAEGTQAAEDVFGQDGETGTNDATDGNDGNDGNDNNDGGDNGYVGGPSGTSDGGNDGGTNVNPNYQDSNTSTNTSTDSNTSTNTPTDTNTTPNTAANIVFTNNAATNTATPTTPGDTNTSTPGDTQQPGQEVVTPAETGTNPDNPTPGATIPASTAPTHTGGGYTDTGGYVPDDIPPEATEDGSIVAPEDVTTEDYEEATDSISSIIGSGSNFTKLPTSNNPIKGGSSSGNAVIPVIAGLSAAAAAGIGAKAYMDRKNNNDNGDDDFEADEWTGEDNLDIDYNDGIEEEQYLDDDSDFGETETTEKYGARNNDELADLQ